MYGPSIHSEPLWDAYTGLEGQQRTPTDSDFLEESNARRRLGVAAAALPHNSPEVHNVRICEPEPQEEIRPAVEGDGAGTEMEHDGMDSQDFLPDGIKLGLGDFIFYSVLIGRAAMYDTATMFSCYIAIMAGLGCTLLFLVIEQRALPALPMSVTFAVVFYVLTRFVMEPVVLPMTLNLTYF